MYGKLIMYCIRVKSQDAGFAFADSASDTNMTLFAEADVDSFAAGMFL